MTSFATQLSAYMERSAVTDADVAEVAGVKPATVRRWRTGRVRRPRAYTAVLRVADQLALTPAERAEFLAAAGFSPPASPPDPDTPPTPQALATSTADSSANLADTLPATDEPATGEQATIDATKEAVPQPAGSVTALSTEPEDEVDVTDDPAGAAAALDRSKLSFPIPLLAAFAVLTILIVFVFVWATRPQQAQGVATPPADPLLAQPGETLLLMAELAGDEERAAQDASQIQGALTSELGQMSITDARVARWPEAVYDASTAAALAAQQEAAGVIWGETDGDSARVRLTLAEGGEGAGWVPLLSSEDDFVAVIAPEEASEARLLALTVIGQLARQRGDLEQAQEAFLRGSALQPRYAQTEALLHFLLATVLEQTNPPDLTRAIAEYGRVIPLRPEWLNVRYNRGRAYLARYFAGGEPDLLDAAEADFSRVIAAAPAFGDAFYQRGIARYERNRPGDMDSAYADMTAALARSPGSAEVYRQRGLLNLRRGDGQWRADLYRALDATPNDANLHAALCRGHLQENEPIHALKACNRALALDDSLPLQGSRGIAYALLGRSDDAQKELNAYLSWLAQQPNSETASYRRAQVEEWLTALEQNDMPFDAQTLSGLRD